MGYRKTSWIWTIGHGGLISGLYDQPQNCSASTQGPRPSLPRLSPVTTVLPLPPTPPPVLPVGSHTLAHILSLARKLMPPLPIKFYLFSKTRSKSCLLYESLSQQSPWPPPFDFILDHVFIRRETGMVWEQVPWEPHLVQWESPMGEHHPWYVLSEKETKRERLRTTNQYHLISA